MGGKGWTCGGGDGKMRGMEDESASRRTAGTAAGEWFGRVAESVWKGPSWGVGMWVAGVAAVCWVEERGWGLQGAAAEGALIGVFLVAHLVPLALMAAVWAWQVRRRKWKRAVLTGVCLFGLAVAGTGLLGAAFGESPAFELALVTTGMGLGCAVWVGAIWGAVKAIRWAPRWAIGGAVVGAAVQAASWACTRGADDFHVVQNAKFFFYGCPLECVWPVLHPLLPEHPLAVAAKLAVNVALFAAAGALAGVVVRRAGRGGA